MLKYFLVFLLTLIPSLHSYGASMKLKTTYFHHTKIHYIEFDPPRFHLSIARALDGQIGREDIESIAKRNNAIAAINGSFWEAGGRVDGIPAFLLKVGNQIFVDKGEYSSAGFNSQGNLIFTKVKSTPQVRINGKSLECAINMPQSKSPLVVYTSAYGQKTLTDPLINEVVVRENKVIDINTKGNNHIPENGFVLSSSKALRVKIGDKVELMPSLPNALKDLDFIVSGYMLFQNKNLDEYLTNPANRSSFRDAKHARSAICKMENGNIVLAATEYVYEKDIKTMTTKEMIEFMESTGLKREEIMKMTMGSLYGHYHKVMTELGHSKGLSMNDFAQALLNIGCTDALNLDGGTSTTLIYKNKVIAGSKPKLQKDSDAIIVGRR